MRRRRAHRATLVLLAAALAVGASAHAFAQPIQAKGPGCAIVRQAALPLVESHGRFTVPVSLNDAALMMMIDSGAQRAAITPQTAARLGLPVDSRSTYRANGIGGRSVGEHPYVARSVRFGPKLWPQYDIQSAAISRPEQAGDPAAPVGLIGADMLSAYDVELDFPGHTLTLYSVTGCTGAFFPWPGRFDTFVSQAGPDDLFVIPVTLNGHPLRALLDTGSNTTILSRSAARESGLDAARASDRAESYTGTKGVAVTAHRRRFDTMAIGALAFRNAGIGVQDADFGPFDMLLGMDILHARKLWLSYRTHEVFLSLARPPAPAATPPAAPQAAPQAAH